MKKKNIKSKTENLRPPTEDVLKNNENILLEKLINASKNFIQFSDETPDYNEILQTMLDISGAKYAALNIFDDNGLDFRTVALAGINENITKGLSILGFDVLNKHWKHDPLRANKIEHQTITCFENLHDLTGEVISKSAVYLLEKTFNLGEIFIVKVIKDNKALGDFALIFNKGETLQNISLVDLYAHQFGMFLERVIITHSLRVSESKHAAMISNISDVIGIIDVEGICKDLSSNIEKWFGWKSQELVGSDFWLTVHPDDLVQIKKKFSTLLKKNNSTITLEYRFKCKDGSFDPISLTANNLKNDDKIKGILLNFHEIKERRQAEEALRESEYFFKESQRAANIGSYKTDFVKGFWESSGILDQIFGIDKSYNRSVQGWLDIVFPEDREKMNQYLTEEVIAKRKPFNIEYRIKRKSDGEIRWVHGLGQLFFDDSGKVISMIGTIQDITERKHVEEILQKSESLLRSIAETSKDVIFVKDRNYRFVFMNPEGYRFNGKTPEQLLGRSKADFNPNPEEVAKFNADDQRIMDSGQMETIEEELYSAVDGTRHVYLTTKIPWRDSQNNIIGLTGMAHDITERKRTEEVLRESEYFFKESQRAANIGSYKTDFVKGFWESSEILDQIFGIDKSYNRTVQGWLDI